MNHRTLARRPLAVLALAFAAAAAASSAQLHAATQPLAAAALAEPPGGALERALDSIKTENIRSDIFFIASDELGGRDTPSLGQRVAARYIRARMVRLGLQPGNGESFLYEYPLASSQIDDQATRLTIQTRGGPRELTLGRDYFPQPFGFGSGKIEGRVVFAGKGSTEELAQAKVSGAWALCYEADSSRQRSRAAREAGAIGVIAIPAPDYRGEPFERRSAEALTRLSRAGVRYPSPEGEERSERRNIAQVHLSGETAAAIWPELSKEGGAPALGTELASACTDERATAGGGSVLVENVCAFWPGSDPELSKEVILISAHYDHVGTNSRGEIHNGADDNGSGTTGLMALAEALAAHGPLRRSVMLIWVSGEEKGLWGSRAWTENPSLPAGHKPLCNINIDMIGRNAPDKLLITPTEKMKQYNGLTRLAEKLAPLEGFPKLGSCDEYWARSDQMNFSVNLGIPVAFLFSDVHEDYHRPSDDPEKVDCDKIRRVTRLVMRMLDGLQADPLEL
ncbi:MAG TPA: M28 family peptidase [Planctomycetota bacterium]|nr:M28 family peptidase [Planctomycetota bacterium]